MRRFLLHSVVLSALMVGAAVADDAEPIAQALLKKMVDAAGTLAFTGTLVYGDANSLDAMEVVRIGEEQRERIATLTGEHREMFRDSVRVSWLLPREKVLIVDQSEGQRRLTELTRDQIRELPRWYELRLKGVDRVAGRDARVVEVLPRDDYRYAYRLWLDRETGLLLRSQCHNSDQELLEHFMFVSLKLDKGQASEHIEYTIDHRGFKEMESEVESINESSQEWHAADLPPGYRLLSAHLRSPPGSSESVQHYLYGDGLGAVSVYITAGGENGLDGYSERGNTRMAGREHGDYHITVVGEVPRATVERVLAGMQRRGAR
ncbi:MAG: MucB/RseB C-terminal domain-containing protein [Ectothiorhodospiraceae bacterium]|nr:MucB/RseB C-terminal domain-containing protein [Ectothiorhodospiraceae bacterium]